MSIMRETRKFIYEHPSIRDCLSRGLINYSALSRLICDECSIDKFDAVLVACRRYSLKVKGQETTEKNIVNLVRRAKVRVTNKIFVAILDKPKDYDRLYSLQKNVRKNKGDFNWVESEEALILIADTDILDEIKILFRGRIKKLSTNLAQISMKLSRHVETTPGVVSYVYGLLADNGINVLEEMSCWTDLMIIVDEADLSKALKVLRV